MKVVAKLPDVNEEDYLDNLLKSMSNEQMAEEQITEEQKTEKHKDESILTPEEVARMALSNSDNLDVSDADIDMIHDDEQELNDEALDNHIDKMLEDIDASYVSSLAGAEHDTSIDEASEVLSPSELERLVSMNLDGIIDDVTSDSFSVNELFKNEAETSEKETAENEASENALTDMQAEETSDISASEETASMLEDEVSAAQVLGLNQGMPEEAKTEKGKNKKKKFLSVIKNIFFESIEEDNLENVDAAAVNNKASEESAPKDENEKLIEEVYGGKEHIDDESAPQKGFFAKVKYRLQQKKLQNEEEERLELEAEELDEQEKKQRREDKKAADAEIKENKKKAKAEKPKKEKKEKPKKEKKPKKDKKPVMPGDILKFKPKSVVTFTLFIVGVIVLIQVMNMSMNHSSKVSSAKAYYTAGDYAKAYDCLDGISLSKNEKTLYEQASVLMYVQRQYDSYVNYMKLNMKTEALNALIKGIDRHNTYYEQAKELGVGNQIDAIKDSILEKLQSTFKISESEGNSLADMMVNDFTKYYMTIEAYGEAAK